VLQEKKRSSRFEEVHGGEMWGFLTWCQDGNGKKRSGDVLPELDGARGVEGIVRGAPGVGGWGFEYFILKRRACRIWVSFRGMPDKAANISFDSTIRLHVGSVEERSTRRLF